MKTTKPSGRGKSNRSDSPDIKTQTMTFVWQMMIQEQDQTMNSIAGTLNTIAQQAGLMGSEIREHNEYVALLLS
jgi:hypothetical protein